MISQQLQISRRRINVNGELFVVCFSCKIKKISLQMAGARLSVSKLFLTHDASWRIVGRFLSNYHPGNPALGCPRPVVSLRIFSSRRRDAPLGLAIVSVIFINACFTFTQEYRAEKAFEALKKLFPFHVTLIREGREVGVLAEEVVLGDLILLSEGNKVPADLRLVSGSGTTCLFDSNTVIKNLPDEFSKRSLICLDKKQQHSALCDNLPHSKITAKPL